MIHKVDRSLSSIIQEVPEHAVHVANCKILVHRDGEITHAWYKNGTVQKESSKIA
jgi:hypothetical protein